MCPIGSFGCGMLFLFIFQLFCVSFFYFLLLNFLRNNMCLVYCPIACLSLFCRLNIHYPPFFSFLVFNIWHILINKSLFSLPYHEFPVSIVVIISAFCFLLMPHKWLNDLVGYCYILLCRPFCEFFYCVIFILWLLICIQFSFWYSIRSHL